MKMEDHIVFTAKHGEWKVADRLTEMEPRRIAHFTAGVSNTVNLRIPCYLTGVMDVGKIEEVAGELSRKDLAETITLLKSPGTTRKLGNLVFENDKKLRKLLVEVARALLVRSTLAERVPIEYPEGPLEGVRTEFPYEEDHVNFTAFHTRGNPPWKAVRRLIIDERTPMEDVARVLAAINESITLKLPLYAGINLGGIEAWFGEFKKVKKADIPRVVKRYLEFPAEDHAPEEFTEHARVYALRKALEKIGLPLDVPAKSLEKYLEKKAG